PSGIVGSEAGLEDRGAAGGAELRAEERVAAARGVRGLLPRVEPEALALERVRRQVDDAPGAERAEIDVGPREMERGDRFEQLLAVRSPALQRRYAGRAVRAEH